MAEKPLFTIMTLAYNRLDCTRQSLKAMMGQTYKNLEIIVVNNGATPEITDYLVKTRAADNRIKIIHYKENQWSDDDPALIIRVCYNDALKAATGDYVFYQSDDDLISSDYVEKMVALFQGNPECTSAAGFFECIDESGELLPAGPRIHNYRPRYMPGHLLALSTLSRDLPEMAVTMFDAPGCIFTFKREEFVKVGGFSVHIEHGQLYGMVPFGVTGFDETAMFYWRRHQAQTNKSLMAIGYTGSSDAILMLKDFQIGQRWQVFGKHISQYVVRRLLEKAYGHATYWFVYTLYNFRFKACWRIFRDSAGHFYFWRELLQTVWKEKRQLWWYLRPKVRRIFEKHPWLTQKFPFLMPIKNIVFKSAPPGSFSLN